MDTAKHTPGPWAYYMPDSIAVNPSGSAFIIGPTRICMDISVGFSLGDARLIAAAPELLEALEAVRKIIESSDEWWMTCPDRGGFDIDALDSVIAKASGLNPD